MEVAPLAVMMDIGVPIAMALIARLSEGSGPPTGRAP